MGQTAWQYKPLNQQQGSTRVVVLSALAVLAGAICVLVSLQQRQRGTRLPEFGRVTYAIGEVPTSARDAPEPSLCTFEELLVDLDSAYLPDDAPSRTSLALEDSRRRPLEVYRQSPRFPRCGIRTFTSHQACELLSAFGGVYLIGDSLIRHMYSALLMLLSDDLAGSVTPDFGESCAGEANFVEKAHCFEHLWKSSAENPSPVCQGRVPVTFVPRGRPRRYGNHTTSVFDTWNEFPLWKASLRTPTAQQSPVIVIGTGLHYSLSSAISEIGFIEPLVELLEREREPPPISFWADLHAPGVNKPTGHLWDQASDIVKLYNEQMRAALTRSVADPIHYLGYYGLTDGAASFDGTHYSYLVNMDKIQVLLNLLDRLAHQ